MKVRDLINQLNNLSNDQKDLEVLIDIDIDNGYNNYEASINNVEVSSSGYVIFNATNIN